MDNTQTITPGQLSAGGALLEIDHPAGGLRYMAHVFDLRGGGVAWVDSGWTDPLASTHVCHYLEGAVTPCQGGWHLHSNRDGIIELRPSIRGARPEGDRFVARRGLQQSFGLNELSP